MTSGARPPEYYEKQRAYDAARKDAPGRKAELAQARARYRRDHADRVKQQAAAQEKKRKARSRKTAERKIIGVDGEGQDTPDGRHIYTYLAAVDEDGELVSEAYNADGLSHRECVEMLLSIPKNALKFGFMFSYDVTKIIEQMPANDRYYLMRPPAREAASCLHCKANLARGAKVCTECGSERVRKYTRGLKWKNRTYDYFNGSLTVAGKISDGGKRKLHSTKVWDCFRFFGCAFVEALKDWNIGSKEQVARISEMKNKRGSFDEVDPEKVKAYCREECELLAQMMRKVINAHEDAGIPLTRFDGAGSTATALLKANEVAVHKGPRHHELDPGLADAIACAFFGGRFEDSVVGTVKKPIYGFDISSAYPFALAGLPCLTCGRWRLEKRMTPAKLKKVKIAVGKFHVRHASKQERKSMAWCPLPFRSDKGSITYGTNFTGWSWSPELLAALRGWPDLVQLDGEAWVYETRCKHKPFAFLPAVYRQRIGWGKEGAGKALKLGMNASYGKCAQSIGDDPPFQSWVWAGMTTAITRGQILDAIASAKDRWNVLAIATDGIYAAERLPLKQPPWDTGTSDLVKPNGKACPLGGWEDKDMPEGIFIAKPGLYYRLKAELADVRARGVGRREVFASRAPLEKGFSRWDRRDMSYHVPLTSRRFYGAKHSIYARSSCATCNKSWPGVPELGCRNQACSSYGQVGTSFETQMIETEDGNVAYGTWDVRTVKIAFDPHPKRERAGLSKRGSFAYLTVRDLESKMSAAYDVGTQTTSPEGQAAREAKEIALEQPDWDE